MATTTADVTDPSTAPQALLAQTAWLRRLTGALVRDPHAADDLMQETVLAALSAKPPEREPKDGSAGE